MQYEELEAKGIEFFDAWASTFGQVTSGWEMDATGVNYKLKSRFANFQNVPELLAMYRSFADVVTKNDLDDQARQAGQRPMTPPVTGGKPYNHVVERSDDQAEYMESIIHRMEHLPKDPSKDNPLKITNDARKAGLDYRLIDPDAEDFPGSKINAAVERIYDIWRDTAADRGTQLVFCDLSTPKGGFSAEDKRLFADSEVRFETESTLTTAGEPDPLDTAIRAELRRETERLHSEMVKAGTAAEAAEINAALFSESACAFADRYGFDPVAELQRISVSRGTPGDGETYFHPSKEQIVLADEALHRDSEAWGNSVDAFIVGTLPARQSVAVLNQTPLVLQMLGAKNLPVNTTYGTLKKVLVEKHQLPPETVKQVPAAMADPVMVFESATQAGDLVMMLELKDQHGATVIVPVALEQATPEGYTVNLATSVYAKGNAETGRPNNQWFTKQIQDGNLLYQNKEKSRAWAAMVGLQLPPTHRSSSARKRVHTEADLVKLREANPMLYQAGTPRRYEGWDIDDFDREIKPLHDMADKLEAAYKAAKENSLNALIPSLDLEYGDSALDLRTGYAELYEENEEDWSSLTEKERQETIERAYDKADWTIRDALHELELARNKAELRDRAIVAFTEELESAGYDVNEVKSRLSDSRYLQAEKILGDGEYDTFTIRLSDHYTTRSSVVHETPAIDVDLRDEANIEAGLAALREYIASAGERAKDGNSYFQHDARGAVKLTPEHAAIRLFQNADTTTLPHEAAHIFLDNLLRVVADDGGYAKASYEARRAGGDEAHRLYERHTDGVIELETMAGSGAQRIYERHLAGVAQAKADLRTLREFAGEQYHKMPERADGKTWEAVPLEGELTPGQLLTLQEVTATAFESYLMQGKAPSQKLEGVFSRLKTWLKKMHETAKGYGIEPSQEVSLVFDRMLATDRDMQHSAMLGAASGFDEERGGQHAALDDAGPDADEGVDEGEATDTPKFMDDVVAITSRFSVYDDVKRKLMAKGIPADEIAFIHDANTDIRKAKLFADTQAGRVRVLMGSTSKMGAGMNVQKRLVAAHHLDAPWRPSDLEQRNGRIIRQGNALYERDPENFQVGIYYYATKRTYDARMWQTIEYKAAAIEQFRKGDLLQRVIEDVQSEAANAAEMKAAASGNPLILQQVKLASDLRKLEALYSQHQRSQHRLKDRLKWLSSAQERFDAASAVHASNIKRRDANTLIQRDDKGKERIKAELVVNGRVLGEKDEEAIKAAFVGNVKAAQRGECRVLGSYRGFDVYAIRQFYADTKPEGFRFALRTEEKEFRPENLIYSYDEKLSLSGWFQRMDNFLDKGLEQAFQQQKGTLEREIAELATVQATLGQDFPQKGELALTRENHAAVMRELKRMQDEPEYVSTWEPKIGQETPADKEVDAAFNSSPLAVPAMSETAGQNPEKFLREHIFFGTVQPPSASAPTPASGAGACGVIPPKSQVQQKGGSCRCM